MSVERLEVHVEEPSMEAALRGLLPRVIPRIDLAIFTYQGKPDLLKQLPSRLRGQASWLPSSWRILVIVDVDREKCVELRAGLDQIARDAGLRIRDGQPGWQIVNRIAIEELEAWYFGDWSAVRSAFPRVRENAPSKREYRHPDAIKGGTKEAFARILQNAGYFEGGLQQIAAAREIAAHLDVARNTSPSFAKLREVLDELAIASSSDAAG